MQPAVPSALPAAQAPAHGGVSPATAALLGAADSAFETRRFEVAGVGVDIRQDLKGSNALRPLDDDRVWADADGSGGWVDDSAPPRILTADDLSRVGLVAWQAGFVLADLLLRRPPFASWHGVQVLDLGCGTGLVGTLLGLAGAEVTLSDQPHIAVLAEQNARANLTPGLHRWRVLPYVWGVGDAAATLLPPWHPPPTQQAQHAQHARHARQSQHVQAPAVLAGKAWEPAATAAVAATGLEAGEASAGGQRGAAQAPLLEGQQLSQQAFRPPSHCYDVITAADVVYQPECYSDLAGTLRQLAAPHTLVFIAFKRRGLQEDSFLALLEEQGFALAEVPQRQLAEEYREGSYRVVRACRIE